MATVKECLNLGNGPIDLVFRGLEHAAHGEKAMDHVLRVAMNERNSCIVESCGIGFSLVAQRVESTGKQEGRRQLRGAVKVQRHHAMVIGRDVFHGAQIGV